MKDSWRILQERNQYLALALLLCACTWQVKLTPQQYERYMARYHLPTVTPTPEPPLPPMGPRVAPQKRGDDATD